MCVCVCGWVYVYMCVCGWVYVYICVCVSKGVWKWKEEKEGSWIHLVSFTEILAFRHIELCALMTEDKCESWVEGGLGAVSAAAALLLIPPLISTVLFRYCCKNNCQNTCPFSFNTFLFFPFLFCFILHCFFNLFKTEKNVNEWKIFSFLRQLNNIIDATV